MSNASLSARAVDNRPPHPEAVAIAAKLLTWEHIVDPYPTYARLRELEPVLFVKEMNAWLVTRFDDVKTAFSDDRLAVSFAQYQINRQGPAVVEEPYFKIAMSMLVCNDAPLHTRLRRVFRAPFTSARIQGLAPMIEQLCRDRLDALYPSRRADVVADFSREIPLATIGALLNVPRDDYAQVAQWVYDFAPVLEVSPMTDEQLSRSNDAIVGLESYFTDLVAHRRESPGEDFISAVIQANDADPEPMSESQLVNNLSLLYFAGQDTQKYQFTNMVAALDANPEAYEYVLQDIPGRVGILARELYRYDSTSQFMGRTAREDVELGGQLIRAGETVMICNGGSNRDAGKFSDPDAIRFDRGPTNDMNAFMSFGAGRHRCLGVHLAQLQLPIMLQTFLETLGRVHVERKAAIRHPSIATRGYDVLPVTWEVRSPA
ncbi:MULTISPECIES: cytochrome P450 [Mycobacterium]|uniref:Cytochrome P450 n=1 Tax=Mycobacterium kiyosense TaxID=2871094 RepID=A0A9P3Q7M1_9MYCO|nr:MULTISPECIES: cytochrome P450 [Mycobacterium]BDB39644.1 cytochrome P450 [Mycobacterium kiyosense]BDE11504.1 cytochrome P450 [Mycobacterium sp. 20KCMC460]GLB82412.1 cytochrome P450 [Mycobacterium kiyosense]GLB88881.1 cytochrome P450 [Mycobacterium kiyosense]GLB95627.1 cytochrome P450 [Mycobacterium kiyosense]